MSKDRFKKLSHNYADLFSQVLQEQGMGPTELQETISSVLQKYSINKKCTILDIGIGDEESTAPLLKAGYKNITGLDMNSSMLEVSKERFKNKVRLIKGDAVNITSYFKPEEFECIISAATIHNIPKVERKKFWKNLIHLSPSIFVIADKIADENIETHKQNYDREIQSIIKIYKEKNNLPELANEWIEHYEYDESEKLTLNEIFSNLQEKFKLHIYYEKSMYKTLIAIKIEN